MSLTSSWPTSKRSGWLTGTEMAVVPVTALPDTAPVPARLTVMLATVPVKPEAGSTGKLTVCMVSGCSEPR